MEKQPEWKAKTAFLCYVTLFAGLVAGSMVVAIVIFGLKIDVQESGFPLALLSLPVTEGIILGITLLFARAEGASLRNLGLKKPNPKTIAVVSLAAVLLIFVAGTISVAEEVVFGPAPETDTLTEALLPNGLLQLIAMVSISILLVGPAEELAFRGFVQKGFQNSYGKTTGLLIASVLFGLLHGLNSLWSIAPVTVVGLVMGYIWQKTDENTTAVAWMHGLYDAITITIAFLVYT